MYGRYKLVTSNPQIITKLFIGNIYETGKEMGIMISHFAEATAVGEKQKVI